MKTWLYQLGKFFVRRRGKGDAAGKSLRRALAQETAEAISRCNQRNHSEGSRRKTSEF